MVYTYSANKNFVQTVSEQTIKPGEIFAIPLDTEFISTLPSGLYTLNVWLTGQVEGQNKLGTYIEFKVEKPATDLVPKTIEVTFTGIIDESSFEAKNTDGVADTYRVPDTLRSDMEKIRDGSKVKVTYTVDENNRNMVTKIEPVK